MTPVHLIAQVKQLQEQAEIDEDIVKHLLILRILGLPQSFMAFQVRFGFPSPAAPAFAVDFPGFCRSDAWQEWHRFFNPAQNGSVWGSCYRDQLLAEHVSLQRIISAAISTFDADRLIVFLQNLLTLAVGIQVCSEMIWEGVSSAEASYMHRISCLYQSKENGEPWAGWGGESWRLLYVYLEITPCSIVSEATTIQTLAQHGMKSDS